MTEASFADMIGMSPSGSFAMDWLHARRVRVTSDRYASGTLRGYDGGLVGLTNLVIIAIDIP